MKQPAEDWLHPSGRTKTIRNARVTDDEYPLAAIVVTKAKDMKEAWFLATNRPDFSGAPVVKMYGKRFTIEENFRDTRDIRFGMGMSASSVSTPERRDRLFLLAAMAQTLLTLLGAAGEEVGLDSRLKSNTSKRRQHSLYNQGVYWYHAIPKMAEAKRRILMSAFDKIVRRHEFFRQAFGVI